VAAAAADFFPPDYDGIRPTLNTVSPNGSYLQSFTSKYEPADALNSH
jgi:hypothetical protein